MWISRLPETRSLLLFLVLFPVADAVLMFRFIGAYMVTTTALRLLIGGWLLQHGKTPAAK